MKKIMYMAVAAIAALSSCSSEDIAGSNGISGEAKVFTATIESDGVTSRTTYDASAKKTAWIATTDKVNIGGAEYTAYQSGATTTFTGTGATAESGKYKAYYPSSMYESSTSIKLPASYTYNADQFNMPMYAESTTTELGFQNICGVLAITVKSDQIATVKSITVTSNNAISGICTISETSGKYSATATGTADADKKVTLNCETAVTLDATGTVFYLPVPAGSHTLKVEVSDGTATKYMTTSSAVDIARNKVYSINFSGKHTLLDYVTITGADNTTKKWATMNLGATSVAESPETAFGDYYAWGATETWYNNKSGITYTWNSSSSGYDVTFASTDFWKSDYTDGYSSSHVPAVSGSTLSATEDIATITYPGWRMATSEEFKWLADACNTGSGSYIVTNVASTDAIPTTKGIYFIAKRDGTTETYKVPGMLFIDKEGKSVFFPAAGIIINTSLHDAGTYGNYWSSSLRKAYGAYHLYFRSDRVDPQGSDYRYHGFTVRPVSE